MKKWIQIPIPVMIILFSLVGFFMIGITAHTYEKLLASSDRQFESRTVLNYIKNKVRQNDGLGPIEIREQEGRQILVLQDEREEEIYEIWIYTYEQKLYEVYVSAGTKISLEDGFSLLDTKDLSFEKEGDLLRIKLITLQNELYELNIRLRSV